MGELNAVPMRINKGEGAAGQVKVSGGPGVLETWGTPVVGAFTEIGDIILGAPAASIEFSGIAAGYAVFLLIWHDVYGDNAAEQQLRLTFNSDGGANYDFIIKDFSGTGTTSNAQTFIHIGNCGDTDGNELHSNGFLLLLNRATSEKVGIGTGVNFKKGGVDVEDLLSYHLENKWRNVADEIDTVTITPSVGNFVAGSRVILLGVRT